MARTLNTILATLSALGALGAIYWLLFGFAPSSQSLHPVAEIRGVFNQVQWRRAHDLAWEDGRHGDALFEHDTVRTQERSRAVVDYVAGLTLNVDPSSMVVISAPTVGEDGLTMQEVLVDSGTVTGEVRGGRKVIRILNHSKDEVARLIASGSSGAPLRYRVRQSEAGGSELSLLSGEALIVRGDERLQIEAGQSVSLNQGTKASLHTLPLFPGSLRPGVDERIRLETAHPSVVVGWQSVQEAARYRLQIARSFGFDSLQVDLFTEGTDFFFTPHVAGTWYWRVASLDGDGRQGEYGYVRRFYVKNLPSESPSGDGNVVPAPLETPTDGGTPDAADASEDAPRSEIEALAVEEDFFIKGQVLAKGLTRQMKGRGPFKSIRGRVKLGAKDVLKASRATGLKLGRGAVLGTDEDTQIVLSKAGKKAGRRVIVMDLQSGGVTTDLSGSKSAMATVVIQSRGARVFIDGEGDKGGRARTERLPDGLRVIAERGTIRVRGAGGQATLPAGYTLLVPNGGAPGAAMSLPAPPVPRLPENGASFVTLDSPPPVDFVWSAVPEAERYRFSISFDAGGTAILFAADRKKTSYSANGLRPGRYYWTVQAVSIDDIPGRPTVRRSFTITKDTKPPKVTLSSPRDGISVTAESVLVRGQTEAKARVKINGKLAELEAGEFELRVQLAPGLNQIVIEAVDPANNVTFKNLKIRRDAE